jgi:hypothetical protein
MAARVVIEAWAPEYGAPIEETILTATAEAVDVAVEVDPAQWVPRSPAAGTCPPAVVRFVDGVRRIDARVWITDPAGVARPGICASYAAGVVRCDGAAAVEAAAVRRSLFCRADDTITPLTTRHGEFAIRAVADDDPEQLSIALQGAMAELENEVSASAAGGSADEPFVLIVDGPLRERHQLPGAIGYVKTHHRSYLPEPLLPVVGQLRAAERTPLFLIDGRVRRWSWYVRLPVEVTHMWAGVVRCEASADLSASAAIAVADRVAVTLPRFASAPQKDPRAPQNLYPIAGLERELRRRLGDPTVVHRALRVAAA